MFTPQFIALAIPLAFILWGVITYNTLVRQTQMVREAWSSVDVELKRRANLVPGLVDTIKGYTAHESSLLTSVAALRNAALAAGDELDTRGEMEGRLGTAIRQLLGLAEAYPELKAAENFQELANELTNTENRIGENRKLYNSRIRNLNITIESFPSNLVARFFTFQKGIYFSLDTPSDAENPGLGNKVSGEE